MCISFGRQTKIKSFLSADDAVTVQTSIYVSKTCILKSSVKARPGKFTLEC